MDVKQLHSAMEVLIEAGHGGKRVELYDPTEKLFSDIGKIYVMKSEEGDFIAITGN